MIYRVILKKIAQPHLPQHPYEFKKRAFYTPIREWFFTQARRAELDRYLSIAALADSGIFDPPRVHSLYKQLLAAETPRDGNAYYRVMKLEWVLMLVLSVQILHVQFVRKQAACFGEVPQTPVTPPPRSGGVFKRLFGR